MPVNYPKLHWHKHAFEDILAKGPTHHYSTKPTRNATVLSERVIFGIQTNGMSANRYVYSEALQMYTCYIVCKILGDSHHHLAIKYVHQRITDLEEYQHEVDIDVEDDHEPNIDTKTHRSRRFRVGHVLLGSYQSKRTFEAVEIAHASLSDSAFVTFRKHLTTYLNITLPAEGIDLPNSCGVHFHTGDTVSLCYVTFP